MLSFFLRQIFKKRLVCLKLLTCSFSLRILSVQVSIRSFCKTAVIHCQNQAKHVREPSLRQKSPNITSEDTLSYRTYRTISFIVSLVIFPAKGWYSKEWEDDTRKKRAYESLKPLPERMEHFSVELDP